MTLLALAAELPKMHVVLYVTRSAVACELDHGRGLAMALRALQLLMRAVQHEAGSALVIEGPDVPAVRRMAVLALLAQASLVLVGRLVAAVAARSGARIRRREMTLLAWHGDVLTD